MGNWTSCVWTRTGAKRNRMLWSGKMLRLLPITMLLCLGLLGCGRVQSTDVIGTWSMTDSSRQILPIELQKNSAKIVLAANGNLSLYRSMSGVMVFGVSRLENWKQRLGRLSQTPSGRNGTPNDGLELTHTLYRHQQLGAIVSNSCLP